MMKILLFLLFIASVFTSTGQKKEVFLVSRMDGSMLLPETLESIIFWGYGHEVTPSSSSKISLPGPTLRFDRGDTVLIRLYNTSPESHTIHWHGLDVDQENDGVGHTSHDVIPQDTFTYEFVCSHSGTYMYHCHVQTPLHLAMGMYGLFIVNGVSNEHLYLTDTKFTKEFSFLLSEMNTTWNSNPTSPGPFALYEADYLMINGVSGQQLNEEQHKIKASTNDTLAFRMANIGYGSNHITFPPELSVFTVASDGRTIPKYGVEEITLFPGERYDFIAYPDEAFTGKIRVDYLDLRNNNSVGTNDINVEIEHSLNTQEHNLTSHKITVYPNPSTDFVYIDLNIPIKEIFVYDIRGKQYKTAKTVVDHQIKMDVSTLKSGIYIIQLNEQKVKFVKQ